MKKLVRILFSIVLIFVCISVVRAKDYVDLYLFHSESCPHCKAEIKYLKSLDYDYLKIHYYEVNKYPKLVDKVRKAYDIDNSYVPLTIVGSDYIIGYSESMNDQIEELIQSYHKNGGGYNVVNKIINGKNYKKEFKYNGNIYKKGTSKTIPLLGNIDVKKASLPLISLVIGLVDGFNPCAMWVLLFLITMLINMKDKKKMWILGITFIVASALVYLMFMLSWLTVISQVTQSWFKYLIALVAFVGGFINFKSYFKTRKQEAGCDVTSAKDRKKIISKIQKALSEKKFILSIIGIVLLAFSVNLVELACSAGLPVLFIEILKLNDLSALQYALYIFIYLFFFMIDDIIIFTICMITLKVTGISNKYTKYSHLIGGIIMLLIGLLMAFKTNWLMFNF